MIFKKRGRMIDIEKLQKKGLLRVSENVETDSDGYIEVKNGGQKQESSEQSLPNSDLFGLAGVSKQSDTSAESYSKKEVDEKISRLDRLIYKLEQRIEVLERKAGVTQQNLGPAGW